MKVALENRARESMYCAYTPPATDDVALQLTHEVFWKHRVSAILQYRAPPSCVAEQFVNVHPVIVTDAVLFE